MSRPSFFEGVGVAALAALAGTAVYWSLGAVLGAGEAERFTIAGLGLAYVLYLLARTGAKVGRVSMLALWALVTGCLAVFDPPIILHLAAQLAVAWLTRSLYYHSGVLGALADMLLFGFGAMVAFWAGAQTGSMFAMLWCFYLVQALFPMLPGATASAAADAQPDADEAFERAHASAEAAFKRMSVP